MTCSADEHGAVPGPTSGHLALPREARERLLARIHTPIETRPGRCVRMTYLALLDVAERLERPSAVIGTP